MELVNRHILKVEIYLPNLKLRTTERIGWVNACPQWWLGEGNNPKGLLNQRQWRHCYARKGLFAP
jgi:hypothetical protein